MSAACVPLPTPGAPKRTSRHAVPTCSGGAEHLAGGPSSQAARLFSPFAFNGHLQFSSRAAPVTKCFHQVAFKCAISTPPLYDRGTTPAVTQITVVATPSKALNRTVFQDAQRRGISCASATWLFRHSRPQMEEDPVPTPGQPAQRGSACG